MTPLTKTEIQEAKRLCEEAKITEGTISIIDEHSEYESLSLGVFSDFGNPDKFGGVRGCQLISAYDENSAKLFLLARTLLPRALEQIEEQERLIKILTKPKSKKPLKPKPLDPWDIIDD